MALHMSEAELRRMGVEPGAAPAKNKRAPKEPKATKEDSTLERAFDTAMARFAPALPAPTKEHRFAPPRRWRFDRAWHDHRVAVELDGGTWSNGRHSRGAGYAKDCEKLNQAVADGWAVLRYTSDMLAADAQAVALQVAEVLAGRSL